MRHLAAALFLFALLAAPLAAAQDNDNGSGQSDQGQSGDHGSQGQGNGHGHDGQDDSDMQGGGANDTNESMALNVSQGPDANHLAWDFRGNFHHVREFQVYRATDGQPAQLLATISRHTRTFNDTDMSGLVYTYTVQVGHTDGSPGAQSNPQTTQQSCQWLTLAPTSNPPVMIHKECLQSNPLDGLVVELEQQLGAPPGPSLPSMPSPLQGGLLFLG